MRIDPADLKTDPALNKNVVRAGRFELIDEEGRVRVALTMNETGRHSTPEMTFFDVLGRRIIQIYSMTDRDPGSERPWIGLFGKDGYERCSLGLAGNDKHSPLITLSRGDDLEEVRLAKLLGLLKKNRKAAKAEKSGVLTVKTLRAQRIVGEDKTGRERFAVDIGEAGSCMSMQDPTAGSNFCLAMTDGMMPEFSLSGLDGKSSVLLVPDESGPYVEIEGPAGSSRIVGEREEPTGDIAEIQALGAKLEELHQQYTELLKGLGSRRQAAAAPGATGRQASEVVPPIASAEGGTVADLLQHRPAHPKRRAGAKAGR